MKATDFAFWLQGFFELDGTGPQPPSKPLSGEQVELIKRHLHLVFVHDIDPSMGGHQEQAKLDLIHQGQEPDFPNHAGIHPSTLGPQFPGQKMRC